MGTFFVSYNSCNLPVVSSVLWGHFWSHITAVTYSCIICCIETFLSHITGITYKLYNLLYGDVFLSHIKGITYKLYNLLYGDVFVSYNRYNLPVEQSVVWRLFLSHITGITYKLYNLLYGDVFLPI